MITKRTLLNKLNELEDEIVKVQELGYKVQQTQQSDYILTGKLYDDIEKEVSLVTVSIDSICDKITSVYDEMSDFIATQHIWAVEKSETIANSVISEVDVRMEDQLFDVQETLRESMHDGFKQSKTDTIKHIDCAVSRLQDYIKENNEGYKNAVTYLESHVESLKKVTEVLDDENERLQAEIREKDELLASLRACYDVVLRGLYDRKHIEFVALKTYRGWEYMSHDGSHITDFSEISGINISWEDGDVLKVDLKFEGDECEQED